MYMYAAGRGGDGGGMRMQDFMQPIDRFKFHEFKSFQDFMNACLQSLIKIRSIMHACIHMSLNSKYVQVTGRKLRHGAMARPGGSRQRSESPAGRPCMQYFFIIKLVKIYIRTIDRYVS